MPRVVSFLVLVGFLLLAGAVFFRVMAPFLVPMFLAAVLVVIFKPLHVWFEARLPGRRRLNAAITTVLILLTVLIPTSWLGWKAYQQSRLVVDYLKDSENKKQIVAQLQAQAADITRLYDSTLGDPDKPLEFQAMFDNASSYIGGKFLDIVNAAGKVVFGLIVMVMALYFFLADGPQFTHTILLLSPLDNEYEQELLNQFSSVSRAVVTASLVTAVAQGLLAGLGFYFALNSGAPIFLLIAATIVLAVVPFFGGASVWVPTCVWIYFFQWTTIDGQPHQGDSFHAIALAIYCGLVVSTIDNFIKPWVLHGQSNLHPLLAFMSILGGVAALGPVGILVGPMMVAFVQALLVMVNKELVLMGSEPKVIDLAMTGFEPPPQLEPPAKTATATATGTNGAAAGKPSMPASSTGSAKSAKRRRGRK